MPLAEDQLLWKRAFDRVAAQVEERYRLPVIISDVLDPNTGDFNGVEIRLDHDLDLDLALFVLAHLFGHTAQWASDARAAELGSRYATSPPPAEEMEEVRLYERDASRIALTLFHEAGVSGLDGWLSDWAAADWAYLEHFYRTGARGDFRRFFREGTPPMTPLAIPSFRPGRWLSRYSF